MSKRTKEQITAAYQIASDVFDKRMSRKDGINRLCETHEMNSSSASTFIYNFKLMLHGKVFKRAFSLKEISYCFEQIFCTRSHNDLINAVSALNKHLDYFENQTGTNAKKERELLAQWNDRLKKPRELNTYEATFKELVKKASSDSPEIRQARLAKARKIPKKVKVLSEVYERNPDVKADVLLRANGQCEKCKNDAPFHRKADGTPYLEVHHRKPLKDGGEDTVENTIALCPNCHREEHFGTPTLTLVGSPIVI